MVVKNLMESEPIASIVFLVYAPNSARSMRVVLFLFIDTQYTREIAKSSKIMKNFGKFPYRREKSVNLKGLR
jgi:hypothetical protein